MFPEQVNNPWSLDLNFCIRFFIFPVFISDKHVRQLTVFMYFLKNNLFLNGSLLRTEFLVLKCNLHRTLSLKMQHVCDSFS